MTQQKKHPSTELSDAVAPAREHHRELIEAACAWQAGRARPIDPDLFALICAAAEDDSYRSYDVTPTLWSRTGVAALARCGIPNWCSMRRCLWPEGCPEALWTWFDFLHGTGRMDPRSDPVAELRKPLACYGGLDQNGRELPPGAEREIECECRLPYRETVALLNELGRRCELSGEDLVDTLRRLVSEPAPRWDPPMSGEVGEALGGYGSVGLIDDPGWSEPSRPDPHWFDRGSSDQGRPDPGRPGPAPGP